MVIKESDQKLVYFQVENVANGSLYDLTITSMFNGTPLYTIMKFMVFVGDSRSDVPTTISIQTTPSGLDDITIIIAPVLSGLIVVIIVAGFFCVRRQRRSRSHGKLMRKQ